MREQSPLRVLIADDHEMVRRGLSLVLETEKDFCVVGEASTGRQAVEAVLQQRPDVLVLDLRMPDMDGIAVLKAVKREAPTTRVVLLTGYEADEAILRAVQEGADGFLFKDAPPAELCRAIRLVAAGEAYLQSEVTTKLVHLMAKRAAPLPPRGSTLTPREREILRLMARGHTNQEIAELVGVSLETVRSHVKNILQKLDQPNRTRAVLYALRSGLVSLGDVAD